MAFESYLAEQNSGKRIQYWGIDVNNLWRPVHNRIESYRSLNITSAPMFKYEDAMEYFSHNNLKDANVLILQYVISHFYNNNSISEIGTFFSNLVDRIVVYKREGRPLVVMINDVNSNRRGRDYFKGLIDELSARGLGGTYSQYYFNYRIQNDFQRYGVMHEQNEVLYRIPNKMNSYDPWRECSSAQMLIEIK
jgi:hypothetical protein